MVVMTEIGRHLAPEPVLPAALLPGSLIAELGTAEQGKLLDDAAAGQVRSHLRTKAPQRLCSKGIRGR